MNNREVMQQALEAIRIFREWETGQDYESCRATVLARALAAEESLGAALAEPQRQPQKPVVNQQMTTEPVAWRVKVGTTDRFGNRTEMIDYNEIGIGEPLYKSPQPCPTCESLARAIEQRHGIGGQDDTR